MTSNNVTATWSSLILHGVRPTEREIGAGAYGRVFEVNYEGTLCAAKEVHALLLQYAKRNELQKIKDGFLSECQIWSTIRHPCVVQFLGVYYPAMDQYRLPVMVMEKMQQSLRDLVENYDNIPLNVKLSILDEVCLGLRYLHSRNPPIVHRDLSPNNILLSYRLEAKITDLGVAKAVKGDNKRTMTKLPGTPDFMPPEALSKKPVYGPSLDVFSYGGVILNVTTQLWPEPSDRTQLNPDTNVWEVVSEVKRRQQYFDKMTGGTTELKPLVMSCLDDNPKNRPPVVQVSMTIKRAKDECSQKSSRDRMSPIAWWAEVTSPQQSQATSSLTTALEEMTKNNEQLRRENDVLKTGNTQLKTDNTELRTDNDAMKDEIIQLQAKQKDEIGQLTTLLDKMADNNENQLQQINYQSSEIKRMEEENKQLKTENQQLKVTSSLTTTLEEMTINNEQLRRENDVLKADNMELKTSNEVVKDENKQLSALLDMMAVNTENKAQQTNSKIEKIKNENAQMTSSPQRRNDTLIADISQLRTTNCMMKDENEQLTSLLDKMVIDSENQTQQMKQSQDENRQLRIENQQLKRQLHMEESTGDLFSGPVNIKWEEGTPAPVSCYRQTAVWLNGVVYVGGGLVPEWKDSYSINCYDPVNNSWSSSINSPYCSFDMTTLNNKLLVVGGRNKSVKRTNQILTLDAGQLKHYTKMITARSLATAAGHQGMLIITGGYNEKDKRTSSTELFDSNNGSWYICNNLPQPHSHLQSVIVDNNLYLLGGYNKDGIPSSAVFTASLDLLSRHQVKWKVDQDTPWCCSVPVSVQGKQLLVVGGKCTSHVYKFSKVDHSWEAIGHIPSARDSSAVVSTADNKIIVIGGVNNNEEFTSTVWIGSYTRA